VISASTIIISTHNLHLAIYDLLPTLTQVLLGGISYTFASYASLFPTIPKVTSHRPFQLPKKRVHLP
jgi:hypothetical protein